MSSSANHQLQDLQENKIGHVITVSYFSIPSWVNHLLLCICDISIFSYLFWTYSWFLSHSLSSLIKGTLITWTWHRIFQGTSTQLLISIWQIILLHTNNYHTSLLSLHWKTPMWATTITLLLRQSSRKKLMFISWYITSISASDTSTTLRHYLVVICFLTADQLNIFINHEQKQIAFLIFISTAIILIYSYMHTNKTIQASIKNCIMWVTQKQKGKITQWKKKVK